MRTETIGWTISYTLMEKENTAVSEDYTLG